MYLVFIAMLALNIGKEVLKTLGTLNDEIEASTVQIKANSDVVYTFLEQNGPDKENPKYTIAHQQAQSMKNEADAFYDFIQKIKDTLIVEVDNEGNVVSENQYKKDVSYKDTDGKKQTVSMVAYQEMDKSDLLDKMFFAGETITPKAEKYVSFYKNYPQLISEIVNLLPALDSLRVESVLSTGGEISDENVYVNYNFASVIGDASKRFDFKEKILNEEGVFQPFLKYNFEGFPVVASIAKLTKIQLDIRSIENSLLNQMSTALGGGGIMTYKALLDSDKPLFFTNETVNAKIILGNRDSSYQPDRVELFIKREGSSNRITLVEDTDFEINRGEIVLNKRIRQKGIYELTGSIFKDNEVTGNEEFIPVNLKLVIDTESTEATVSAVNMNIFYRGLQNPLSVAVPNADNSTIRLAGTGADFRGTGQNWKVTPGAGIETIDVRVSAVVNGVRSNFNGGTFRIKKAPDGDGSIKVNQDFFSSGNRISTRNLTYGDITGKKPEDFDYDFDYVVTSFDVKVGNSSSITVRGSSIDASPTAATQVANASRGEYVLINNISASTRDGNVVTPGATVKEFLLTIR